MRSEDWRAVWLGAAIAVVSSPAPHHPRGGAGVDGQRARAPHRGGTGAVGDRRRRRPRARRGGGLVDHPTSDGRRPRRTDRRDRRSSSLVVVAYNSTDLRFEDQLVGTLIIVVLPGYVAAVIVGAIAALARPDVRRPADVTGRRELPHDLTQSTYDLLGSLTAGASPRWAGTMELPTERPRVSARAKPERVISATSRSSPTSTTARPPSSTPCSGRPARSGPTRRSPTGSWTR